MAINKKLIHFAKRENFDTRLANNEINDTSIVFIQDTGELWTHGQFFCTTATNLLEAPSLLTVGDTIAVQIGDKTSNYIVPPAAQKGRTMYECITATTDTRGHWTGTIPGVTELYDGLVIHVRFTTAYYGNGEGYNTLNINNLGPKLVWFRYNSILTSHWSSNTEMTLTYRTTAGSYKVTNAKGELVNGTTYTDGWVADFAYYTYTDYMSGSYYYRYKVNANGYIGRYMIVMRCPDGTITGLTTTNNSTATTKIMFSGPLLLDDVHYYSSTNTYAANAVFTHDGGYMKNNAGLVDVRYTFNCGSTLVANKSFFIVGTIGNDGYFYLDQTQPWSLDYPTTEDNKLYILIGPCFDTYRVNFELYNPIYVFKNGKLQLYSQYVSETEWANITGKPSTFTPSTHTHPYTDLTGSTTTADQAIVSSGTANGWTLKTLGSHAFDSTEYVTVATNQTVSGVKTFSNGFKLTTASAWDNADRGIPFSKTTAPLEIQYVYTDANKGLTFNPNTGALKAGSFVKRGGTSSQFLKADGSVDSNTYLTASNITNYYHWTDTIPSNNSTIDGTIKHYFKLDNRRTNDYFHTIGVLAGRKDYFYCAHLNPSYTITSSRVSGINYLFTAALNSNASIPVDVSSSSPAIITVQKNNGYICATDTTYLMFVGHTGGNVGYLSDYSIEINITSASASSPFNGSTGWQTIVNRANVQDEINGLILPIHLTTSYANISGIRITINGVHSNVTWTDSFPIASMRLIDTRPSFSAVEGLNGLDVAGGTIYGSVTSYGSLTLNNTLTTTNSVIFSGLDSGTGDVVDGTEFLTSYAAANGFSTSGYVGKVYKRPVSKLYNYLKGKFDALYLGINTPPSQIGTSTVGATDRPIYLSSGTPTQTTYRMAGTNATATTARAISDNLETGIWYVNGTSGIYNINDGAAYVNKYSDLWIAEIYQDYRTGQIAVRGKNSGTWQAWRKVLDSSNFNTWAPTLDGTGATGTWGIGITGNAGTATEFASAQSVTLTGDTTGTASSKAGWSISTTTNYLSSTTGWTTTPGNQKLKYTAAISKGSTGIFTATSNANSIITLSRYDGNYDSQLGFSSDGNLYYRRFNGVAIDTTTSWKQIAFTDSNITGQASYAANVGSAGTLGTNYVTATKVIAACNWYDTVTGSDTDSVINRWDEIVNFVSGFEETPDLATYLSNNYLAKTGNSTSSPMTGTIYTEGVNALVLQSNNQDLDIWRVSGNTTKWDYNYGFYLRYNGTGQGNDNSLSLWANNITGNDIEVYQVKQDGVLNFLQAPTINGTAISLTTHDHDDMYLKLIGGTLTGTLNLDSATMGAVAHLTFNRQYSYIQNTASSGKFCFLANNAAAGASANADLIIDDGSIYPGTSGHTSLGLSTSRFNQLHLNGALTAYSTVYFKGLTEGTSDVTDDTELVTSYADTSGFANANGAGQAYRRKATKLYNYIKGKTDDLYVTLNTAQTISGIKTLSNHSYLRFDAPTNTVISSLTSSNILSYSPLAWNSWHDHFAMLRTYTITSVEYSTDGSTWNNRDISLKPLFIHKETSNVNILRASDLAFRFVMQGTQMHACRIAWIVLGINYSTPFSATTLTIEYSADATTWTQWFTGSLAVVQTTSFLKVSDLASNQQYIRFTFTKTSNLTTGTVSLNSINGLTERKGNQGLGREYQYPYSWNENLDIYPIATNTQDLGTSSYMWNNLYAKTIYQNGSSINSLYVTSVGVTDDTTNHANQLRYVKNGTSTYFTVPFATNSTNATNATTARNANQLLAMSSNEVCIGTTATPADATNATVWINYRSGYGGTTSDAATQITEYRFGNRKGTTTGVTLYAATFNGNATSATKADNLNKSTLGYLYQSATTTTGSTGTVTATSGKIGVPIQFYGSQVNYALNNDLFYATVASNAITADTIYLGDAIKSKTFVKTSTHVPTGASSGSSSSGTSGESITYTAGNGIKIAGTQISTNTWTGTESQFAELSNPGSYDLIYIIED